MTAIPITAATLRDARHRFRHRDYRRFFAPAATLLLVVVLSVVAVLGESHATLPVDVRILSARDPLNLGATTQASVMLTNHGTKDVRPRFSLLWLPFPYYWRVVSGPPVLQPGQTATYEIEAPESIAAPHDGEEFQIRVNDAASITYAISSPITNGRTTLAVANPGLRLWTERDTVTGQVGPAGWRTYRNTGDDDEATIEPASALGVDAAHFHVVQRGKPDPDQWAHTGLSQIIPFPTRPLDVTVLSHVSYQAISDGWLLTAFGIEISGSKRESIWLLFETTGSGDREYDLPNGQHIKVYDVPPGEWTTKTIDLRALYGRLNWAPPKRVVLKLFLGASSFTKADIDGYIAGINVHEDAAAQPTPEQRVTDR